MTLEYIEVKGEVDLLDFIPLEQHAAIGSRSSSYDATAGIDAAIESGARSIRLPRGRVLTTGGHSIGNVRLIGYGISDSELFITESNAIGLTIGNANLPGAGGENFAIVSDQSGVTGVLLNRCDHARLENVQVDTCENGFFFRNSDNDWTECNLLIGCRVRNTKYGFRFGQLDGNDGTASFAYNKLIGCTVSSMPSDSIGLWIEYTASNSPDLYSAIIDMNIYLATSANCYGVKVDGRLQKSSLRIHGEDPGGDGTAKAIWLGANGQFNRNSGDIVFGGCSIGGDSGYIHTRNSLFWFDSVTGATQHCVMERALPDLSRGDGAFFSRPQAAADKAAMTLDYVADTDGTAGLRIVNAQEFTDDVGNEFLKIAVNGNDRKIPLYNNSEALIGSSWRQNKPIEISRVKLSPIATPTVDASYASIYVDSADGKLKVKLQDNTVVVLTP